MNYINPQMIISSYKNQDKLNNFFNQRSNNTDDSLMNLDMVVKNNNISSLSGFNPSDYNKYSNNHNLLNNPLNIINNNPSNNNSLLYNPTNKAINAATNLLNSDVANKISNKEGFSMKTDHVTVSNLEDIFNNPTVLKIIIFIMCLIMIYMFIQITTLKIEQKILNSVHV
jgi:hypothetical protein